MHDKIKVDGELLSQEDCIHGEELAMDLFLGESSTGHEQGHQPVPSKAGKDGPCWGPVSSSGGLRSSWDPTIQQPWYAPYQSSPAKSGFDKQSAHSGRR